MVLCVVEFVKPGSNSNWQCHPMMEIKWAFLYLRSLRLLWFWLSSTRLCVSILLKCIWSVIPAFLLCFLNIHYVTSIPYATSLLRRKYLLRIAPLARTLFSQRDSLFLSEEIKNIFHLKTNFIQNDKYCSIPCITEFYAIKMNYFLNLKREKMSSVI